ncbi:MAG TPA: tRNA (adenosine(37)-N6)-threonylcarbamoyltransferase complex dimerization subunit type 1 TsaB [Candidatus Dormibacteraeota bacterium]|nr:tRNA (adenosine(37)-N6)-threonylcarbamoyltransferase complex dimerization subunit type 1 TsaB [Candidatus Dormibacteraeota bacterium]
MIILSIDTGDPHGSVAVAVDNRPVQMMVHDTQEEYSAWLLPTVNHALRLHGIDMSDVDLYAVAVGPGSFTGVRVGLATVKAWAEVYGRPAAAVSRLEAAASQSAETAPLIGAFLDASRGQIFGALYSDTGGELQLVEEERVSDPEEFLEFADGVAGGRRVHWISSDPERMEGSERWRATREARGPVKRVGKYLAEAIGLIGYKKALKGQTVDGLGLDANYVRRPDAEVLWKGIAAKS